MKLWIDDERPAPYGWTPATSFDDAKALLQDAILNRTLDAVSFDHDLGDADERRNGYALACVMEQAAVDGWLTWFNGPIVCRSDNGPGRLKIDAAIASIIRIIERGR